jgi:hypothetical protein
LSFFFVVTHFSVARCAIRLYKWDIASAELAKHGRHDMNTNAIAYSLASDLARIHLADGRHAIVRAELASYIRRSTAAGRRYQRPDGRLVKSAQAAIDAWVASV